MPIYFDTVQAKGHTLVDAYGQANNNTVVIYTVPALRTFFLAFASMALSFAAYGVGGDVTLQHDTGGDGVFRTIAVLSSGTTAAGTSSLGPVLPISPAVCLPYVAGTVFRVISNANNLIGRAMVMGWVE